MKLYVLNYSSYRSDIDNIDIKSELKKNYKLDTRRQNKFIHLGILGAKKLQERVDIAVDDELYITSGIGNIEIIQKAAKYDYEDDFMPIFDFINMLGNTTSYYISKALNIKGKSLFQISDNFTFINTLISIYASLYTSKKNAILGSIDLVSEPDEIIKRVLGVREECELTSSVNYQKLSLCSKDAIAEIEFDTQCYSLIEIEEILKVNNTTVYSSMRCSNLNSIKENKFFQTEISFTLNSAISLNKEMIYIDCFEENYKILRLKSLV
jgi:hypothetical protein